MTTKTFREEFLRMKRDVAFKKGGKTWRKYKQARSLIRHIDQQLYFIVKDNKNVFVDDVLKKMETALKLLTEI